MYKLEYKEKISAKADKLSAALQKVGSAAYEQTKSDEPVSPDSSAAETSKDDREENKEDDKKES